MQTLSKMFQAMWDFFSHW